MWQLACVHTCLSAPHEKDALKPLRPVEAHAAEECQRLTRGSDSIQIFAGLGSHLPVTSTQDQDHIYSGHGPHLCRARSTSAQGPSRSDLGPWQNTVEGWDELEEEADDSDPPQQHDHKQYERQYLCQFKGSNHICPESSSPSGDPAFLPPDPQPDLLGAPPAAPSPLCSPEYVHISLGLIYIPPGLHLAYRPQSFLCTLALQWAASTFGIARKEAEVVLVALRAQESAQCCGAPGLPHVRLHTAYPMHTDSQRTCMACV